MCIATYSRSEEGGVDLKLAEGGVDLKLAGDTDLIAENSALKITWFDCYDLNDRGRIEIDHVLAREEAKRRQAITWTSEWIIPVVKGHTWRNNRSSTLAFGNIYKNPLHLDVVDRYLRRMGDKTIPDEAPPSLVSFYPHASQVSICHSQGVVDSLSRSPICTNKVVF